MTTQETPIPGYQNPAEHAPHVGHIVPLGLLAKIFVALVFLTILTFAASLVDFGELNLVVALLIAVVKASLVILFFMHLRWEKPFNAVIFIGCLVFVCLFISLTLLDSNQYKNSDIGGQAKLVPHVLLQPGQPEKPAGH